MAVPHPDKELDRLRALCKKGLPPVVVLVGTGTWFRTAALEAVLASLGEAVEVLTVEGQDVEARGSRGGEADDAADETDDDGDSSSVKTAAAERCSDLQPLAGGGLFAQRTAVVVRRGDKWLARYAAAVGTFVPRIQKGSLLLVEAQKLDKRTKFAKELAKTEAVFEFRELYETPFGRPDQVLQGELVQWVVAHSKRLSVPVTPESALLLTAQVGKEPSLLAAELEQLAAQFEGGVKKALAPDDLRGKLTCSFESTPFELAEAVLDGDRRRALRSLHAMFARGVKQKDGKRMDQGGLFPFATSWMFSSIGKVHEGRLLVDSGTSLRDVTQQLGVYAFAERFQQQVHKNTAAKLEHGLLALLHCQRERRLSGEEDDVLLERFLSRWFDGAPVPAPEEVEW